MKDNLQLTDKQILSIYKDIVKDYKDDEFFNEWSINKNSNDDKDLPEPKIKSKINWYF